MKFEAPVAENTMDVEWHSHSLLEFPSFQYRFEVKELLNLTRINQCRYLLLSTKVPAMAIKERLQHWSDIS